MSKKYSKTLLLTFLVLVFFGVAKSASADTHYVRKTGGGSACTQAAPCLTIASGLEAMSGGDTLIVGDGTYTERITGSQIPNGSAGAYTKIQAENLHGVELKNTNALYYTSIDDKSYVWLDGFKVNGNLTSDCVIYVAASDHIKVTRCAAYGGANRDNGNVIDVQESDHVLIEECWAWGSERYKIGSYHSNNTIFRRNVARHDYVVTSIQCAPFINYDSFNTIWQNNIAIDSDPNNQYCSGHMYGGFYFENKNDRTDGVHNTSQTMDGNIVLNVGASTYSAGMYARMSGAWSIDNMVIDNPKSGFLFEHGGGVAASAALNHFTATGMSGIYDANNGDFYGSGIGQINGDQGHVINMTLKNSLLYNNSNYGISEYVLNSNYNAFYGNGVPAGGQMFTPSIGANSITNINPANSGLLYLPRIEAGSYLKTAGESGTQIGAEIVNKVGVSGTLYGETGWNTLTSDPLWPFPNEDLIKADFASYSGPGPAGARGFAAGTSIDDSPQTLTKYIWEYLGNQIPAEIYGASSDVTAPSAPAGLSVL